ncbi:MAG: phosphodiester glycosidase family protein [Clostridia bacterium]|nr:phosphodiester glycosidase family protein [Clostridia bacterium]
MKHAFRRTLGVLFAIAMLMGMMIPIAGAAEVTDYQTFIDRLVVLEQYADAYAIANPAYDANELVLNFIRTGVERYNDGNWKILAGEEITAFTDYVRQQDVANQTKAMDLRDIVIEDFTLPNGNYVDFGHMFGTMNISYVVSAVPSEDLAGWAGDICDLVWFSKMDAKIQVQDDIEAMTAEIREHCMGVNAEDAFGWDDFYGDMDAFYLVAQLETGYDYLSTIMENYFTAELSDGDRAVYFLNNRFPGVVTKQAVREAVYSAYDKNVGIGILEADRGLTEDTAFRMACCYAFADYVFEQAGDRLEGGEDPVDPKPEEPKPEEPTDPEDPEEDEEEKPKNPYYTNFSVTTTPLAPGITQSISYAMTADKKQIVYYVATVDVNRDDVTIMANYKDNDPSKGWGMQRVEEQVQALVANHASSYENFSPIVATNADGYNMSTGKPGGLLVMNGKEWHGVDGDGFFAILKDGSAMIGTQEDYAVYKDQIQEAVGGFGATLVKDGKIATTNNSSRASRTAIGLTADGQVVMMVLDGRQEPFSAGGSMVEIAQIMLEAGCVHAINLDGGGSTTYLSKNEGSDEITLVNRPSDGFARSVATSLVAVSTAKLSKEFDHATIGSEYEYLTVGSSLTLSATGVSGSGHSAPIPENALWQVSDEAIGTVDANGVFTALANGEVEVRLTVDGVTVGAKTLYVVVPDALHMEESVLNVVYDTPTKLPLYATYNGNPVLFHSSDVIAVLQYSNAGHFDGLYFTVYEESEYRTLLVGAALVNDFSVMASVQVNLYRDGEAIFDFDNVTGGDRQLAWDRLVSNAETGDGILYQIIDKSKDMVTDYTFALDMTKIEIPPQLDELTYMLPGYDATAATPWNFLLQLAERVSALTEVKVTAKFDKNLDVDISDLIVFNDFFKLKSAELNEETNELTIVCTWVDQTAAVPPETANPICILTGVHLTPKADAAWDANQRLTVVNSGEVSYNIFLRASALYSFAIIESNQQQYGLKPFENPDYLHEGAPEKGASFGQVYKTFSDTYTLNKADRQGWYSDGNLLYYYVDNVAVTGIHKLPSYEDPNTQLFYEFAEDGSCSGTVTGLIHLNGKVYYAMMGEQKTGWQSVLAEDGNSYFYYFNYYTGAAVNGQQNIDSFNFLFEDYKLVRGCVVKLRDGTGYKYRFGTMWLRNQWVEENGNEYYIAHDYYIVTDGIHKVRSQDGSKFVYYAFDETGVWLKDYSGFFESGGDMYLLKNGQRQDNVGLIYIDGYYYYFRSAGQAVRNARYWVTRTNDLMPQASYNFDEYGRMIDPPVVENPDQPSQPDEPEVLNGIVNKEGVLYYYENNQPVYKGLMQLEDGAYIYARSNGRLATGKYWVSKHNGLLPEGSYNFGTDGKYYIAPVVPEALNGIVEKNGVLYYYENDLLVYKGLMQLEDGAYIYVRSNGQLATGRYWASKHNGLLPEATYDFGTNGKYYPAPVEPEALNGIVNENGVLYYYENNVRVYKGLMQMEDGAYVYVRSGGRVATGRYYVTKHNGLLAEGYYTFGEDGKLYLSTEPEQPDVPDVPDVPDAKNGIVEENGELYYYENDVRVYKGLMQLEDGAYVYVRSGGRVATGRYYVTKHNDLLAQGYYTFGEDGKLYL